MKTIFAFISLLVLAACQSESGGKTEHGQAVPAATAIISGTVSYGERTLLLPGSQLSVVLEDVSRVAAPARQLARLDLTDPGQVPIAFELEYNPSDIDETRTYALRAKIMAADGSLLFVNDAPAPVINHEDGNRVEIVVVKRGHKFTAAGHPGNAEHLTEVDDATELKGEFHADLHDTYWKLLSLSDERIEPEPDQREAHLILRSGENRINGNGGCNIFFGNYTLNDPLIGFSGLGSTMMACDGGMETEQAFLLALNEANRVRVEGQFMELYKNDTRLARFEAIHY